MHFQLHPPVEKTPSIGVYFKNAFHTLKVPPLKSKINTFLLVIPRTFRI